MSSKSDQVVVVKNDDLARRTTLDVKLDSVRAVGHGTHEGSKRVLGGNGAGAPMSEDERKRPSFGP